jgi:subtilisin-like proprotein convertase family protein
MQQTGYAVAVISMLAGAAMARPDFTYMGPAIPIPDGTGVGAPGATASAAMTVPNVMTISSITCSVFIPHSFQGDLRVTLTHVESGTTAVLIDRPYVPQTALGFPAQDYGTSGAMLQLSDGGSGKYDVPAVAAPGITGVNGVWKPETPLSVFLGRSAAGTWRLSAVDYASGDTGSLTGFKLSLTGASTCYANCDGGSAAPFLNAADFQCFINRYSAADPYANCDGSIATPVLNILDFVCFMSRYSAGCSGS